VFAGPVGPDATRTLRSDNRKRLQLVRLWPQTDETCDWWLLALRWPEPAADSPAVAVGEVSLYQGLIAAPPPTPLACRLETNLTKP
jgi:hypothetical protein